MWKRHARALPRDCHVARAYVDEYGLPLYYANNSNMANVNIARLAMTRSVMSNTIIYNTKQRSVHCRTLLFCHMLFFETT